MQRREVIKKAYWFMSASFLAPQLLQLQKLHAADCAYMSDDELFAHLEGALPEGSVSTLSDTGMFHHFHYLHLPKEILENPPKNGFTTLSSMMIADLGIDDYFFAVGLKSTSKNVPNNVDMRVRRQFHCHQVFVSNKQLVDIQNGKKVSVIAYIESGGMPQKNHTFIFNDTKTLEDKRKDTQEKAENESIDLDRKRLKCNVAKHGGVRIFNGSGERVVNSAQTLKDLIQGK